MAGVRGTRDSSDKFSLYKELKREGDTVIFAEGGGEKSFLLMAKVGQILGHVPMHEKVIFANISVQ